jgi:oxygen-independent coproporphyrinogen-3 oxidase
MQELEQVGDLWANCSVDSVYFGGGTPSLLTPAEIEEIMVGIRSRWSIEQAEITLEANPGTLNFEQAQAIRQIGINRLSLGIQALDDQSLRLLGRRCDTKTAMRCYDLARRSGYENISVDLIYGRPSQTLAGWRRELSQIITWQPEHLSLYELSIEPGTRMEQHITSGEISLPDEERCLDMFRLAREITELHGYQWYEISNYAQPGKMSRHNLQIWRGGDYLGLGAAAHSLYSRRTHTGFIQQIQTDKHDDATQWIVAPDSAQSDLGYYLGMRRANPRDLTAYVRDPLASSWQARTRRDLCIEYLINGLRLREGIHLKELKHRYQIDLAELLQAALKPLISAGYAVCSASHLKLSTRGAELLDSIIDYCNCRL